MDLFNFLQISAGVIIVLCVWTFLYKETRFYRFVEYTMIAATTASLTVMNWESVNRIGIQSIQKGSYEFILPFILGALLYSRFWKNKEWLQRYPMAVLTAVSTGLAVRGIVGTEIINQIASTAKLSFNLNNIILVIGVITGIYYFVFTTKLSLPKQVDYPLKKVGRFFIMAMMGFYVGNTFMSRIVTLIDRLQFILFDWIKSLS